MSLLPGLGIMGVAMARNLIKSGKFAKVVVWNRTLSKVRGLLHPGPCWCFVVAVAVCVWRVHCREQCSPEWLLMACVQVRSRVHPQTFVGRGGGDLPTSMQLQHTRGKVSCTPQPLVL